LEEIFKCRIPFFLAQTIEELSKITESENENIDDAFRDIEEISEIFINITEQEKGRLLLQDTPYLFTLVDCPYKSIIANIKDHKEAATSYFSLITNLTAISPKVEEYIEQKYLDRVLQDGINKLFRKITSRRYNRIRENFYGLLANLARKDSVRVKLLNLEGNVEKIHSIMIQVLINQSALDQNDFKWIRSVESILSLYINLTIGVQEDTKKLVLIDKLKVHLPISRYLNLESKQPVYSRVLFRAIQILSKLPVTEDIMGNALKVLK
jgi:hypothetical protein